MAPRAPHDSRMVWVATATSRKSIDRLHEPLPEERPAQLTSTANRRKVFDRAPRLSFSIGERAMKLRLRHLPVVFALAIQSPVQADDTDSQTGPLGKVSF